MKCLLALILGAAALHAGEPRRHVIAVGTPQHPRNDSATVVELADHRLLVVWMEFIGGPLLGHDEAPNHLAAMFSDDGGETWGGKRVLVERAPGQVNVYNPALVRLGDGGALLTYITYDDKLEWNGPMLTSGFAIAISPAGAFSPPRRLWDHQPYLSANNTMIRLRDGRLLRAGDMCATWGGQSKSGCYISDDQGATWTLSADWVTLPLRGTMEAHVAELRDGRLVMAMRNDLGAVFFSHSTDRGVHWSPPQSSGLSAPESMPVLATLPSTGDLVLVWNHALYQPRYNHFGKRTPLTSAVSCDGGATWGHLRNLETDPDTEFSNPSCNFFGPGKFIVTYFSSRMIKPAFPGVFGRSSMSLHTLVGDEAWFESDDREWGDLELRADFQSATGDWQLGLRGLPWLRWRDASPDLRGTAGGWNHLDLVLVGERATIWVNGVKRVANAVLAGASGHDPLPARGPIRLETDGGTRWRNQSVRAIPAEEADRRLAEAEGGGFEERVNGRDLSDWQGAVDSYETKHGCVVCRPGKGGDLLSRDEFENGTILTEYRLPRAGNNGIALRTPAAGHSAANGLEIQILDSEGYNAVQAAAGKKRLEPYQYNGSIYYCVAARQGYERPVGEWNLEKIGVHGQRIQVTLNGTEILDADLAALDRSRLPYRPKGLDHTRGFIGLAGHYDPVEFRSFKVRKE